MLRFMNGKDFFNSFIFDDNFILDEHVNPVSRFYRNPFVLNWQHYFALNQ